MGDRHVHRDDLRKVWKECQEESFWYRGMLFKALLFSLMWSKRRDYAPGARPRCFVGFSVLFPGVLRNSFVQEKAVKGPSITSLFAKLRVYIPS